MLFSGTIRINPSLPFILMNRLCTFLAAFAGISSVAFGEATVTSERLDGEKATAAFKFEKVPMPRRGDAGAKATLTLLDGERDRNGGEVNKLNDGALAASSDAPRSSFFFAAGTDGGRLLVDLGSVIDLKQINTYSWHAGTRGPQVYRVYASDGQAPNFNAQTKRPTAPGEAGWKQLAAVDTRLEGGTPGGQYGVSIGDPSGVLAKARYLLFDFNRTEEADSFGNTFYSEIDLIDAKAPETPEEPAPAARQEIVKSVETEGGGYRFSVDTTEAPDLTEWAQNTMIPVMQKWYPLIVKMLPSEGFTAPKTFSIDFTESYKGVAATAGTRIMCDPRWYRGQLKREALGSIVHELVHVVQQYGNRATRKGTNRPPGWLTEGVPDYIRWYLYEPESRGAEIRPQNAARARYDAAYRPSANFLNFVINKYDKDLIVELNTVLREFRYDAEIWKTRTGHTVEELAEEWKKALEAGTPPAPKS
jgi:hypothetical protein